jgi:hypothetical protein
MLSLLRDTLRSEAGLVMLDALLWGLVMLDALL